NRREFDNLYQRLWRICSRKLLKLSLIMVDIDFFKNYNDKLGHLEGDKCLVKVSSLIQDSVQRSSDLVARFGGEEFVIALFDTNMEQASNIAEKIRVNVEQAAIPHPSSPIGKFITVSLGICVASPHADYSPLKAIKMADQALYTSKENGRNQSNELTLELPSYAR
ncbi:MAG: GGDEF domain-containing protein, partial [Kangiellaceae bacterium]|nr:GGDEF domain-containing protein [Kangiellaceae bacterium]